MTRRRADRQAIRTAQIATIVAACGAVALAVGPVASFLAPDVPLPELRSTADGAGAVVNTGLQSLVISDAAGALAVANPRTLRPIAEQPTAQTPQVADVPTDEPADSPAEEVALEPADTGEWFYIGSIVSAKNAYAWFTVDGVQFLLARGNARDGWRLDEVNPEYVLLTDSNGLQRRLDLLPPSRAWPEPGMRASSKPDPNSPAARMLAASNGRASGAARTNSPVARGPRAEDVYREQINRTRTASLPPGRPGPGSPVNAPPSREADPNAFPATLDPVEFSEFITKVSVSDYDTQWAREILDRAGVELDSPINQQIDRLAQLGVTIDSNPTFFQNFDELVERIITEEPDPTTQEKLKAIIAEQRQAREESGQTGEELDEETKAKLEEIRRKEAGQ